MRLRTAEVLQLRAPLVGTYRASVHDTLSSMHSVLVVLETPDGDRGIGTSDPSPGYSRQTPAEIVAELEAFLPGLVADPPTHPNDFYDRIAATAVEPNAAFAAETAFLDLYAREHGVGLADLFGGSRRRTERLNAWIGIDDPDTMATEAAEWRERGFRSCKLKLSGDAAVDVDRVRAVVDRVGDRMEIRADVNGAYDADTAIEVAHTLESTELAHLEQPVPQTDLHELQRVNESTEMTILADEPVTDVSRLFEILDRGAAGRVKLKALRLGGLTTCRAAIDVAAAAGVSPVIGHGFCHSPAAAAELALISTRTDVHGPFETVGPLKMRDEPFEPTLSMDDGTVHLPDGPGLGIRLDDDMLPQFLV